MHYGNCRWTEIEALDKDRVVVLFPLGAMEQHGHHLPLHTDARLVGELVDRVELQLPDQVLLTPTMWIGASDHHLDYPGTLSFRNSLYVEVIKSQVACLVAAGFERILFVNGHGGNSAPGTVAVNEMANLDDRCDGALIGMVDYWTGPAFAPEKHGMQTPQATHACEYETSLMLEVDRERVDMRQAHANTPVVASRFYHTEYGGLVRLAGRFHRRTPTGSMGRPDLATAEKGASLLDAAVSQLADLVRDFLEWDKSSVLKPSSESTT